MVPKGSGMRTLVVGMGRVGFQSFDNPNIETHHDAISGFSSMELVGTWSFVGPHRSQPLPRFDQLVGVCGVWVSDRLLRAINVLAHPTRAVEVNAADDHTVLASHSTGRTQKRFRVLYLGT